MKKWSLRIGFLLLAWVTYSWVAGTTGLWNQFHIYQKNKAYSLKIDSLEQLKIELDGERARLRSDTLYLEKIIRKDLGMAKKEEQVYMLYSQK